MTTVETKNEAFHRLATQRVERIEDAIRILSNLANPGYEWTPDEVRTYLDRIGQAVVQAQARFEENKLWIVAAPAPALEAEAEAEAEASVDTEPEPIGAIVGVSQRELTMLQIWREPRDDDGTLLEMLAMQREVINALQLELDTMRGSKS